MPVTASNHVRPCIRLVLFASLLCPVLTFKICAFNVRSFGDSKSSDLEIMKTLVRTVSRCDIALLQEVKDRKGKAVPLLLEALNRFNTHYTYEYVASERLGRTSYQEQYVFLYRTETASVKNQYQYPDTQEGDEDAFAREPFVVWFKAPKTVLGEFVLIPQHTSPSNATKEIDELYDVFVEVKRRWRVKNVMLLGDFNAACGYVAKKNRKLIRLYTDPSFIWLIGDDVDTTVKESTDCAYDRIVIHGEDFARGIVPYSAGAFNFAKEYGLTEEQALDVSDHYPVEVDLKDRGLRAAGGGAPHLILACPCLLLALMAEAVSDHFPVEVRLRVRGGGRRRQSAPLLKAPAAFASRLLRGLIQTFYNSTDPTAATTESYSYNYTASA